MNANEIIEAIGDRGHLWTIGITNDPERRKKEHTQDGKDTKYWEMWKADSKNVAETVESHFIDKGMKGGSGGNVDGVQTVYVYIF